jgi:hypothetical protein
MGATEQKAVYLAFFHLGYARMLLIIKTRSKSKRIYPTMCLITSDLVQNSENRLLYFHGDKLLKNPKVRTISTPNPRCL